MFRVFRASGEEALAVQFDELAQMLSEEGQRVTILAVKRHMQPLCGQPRFKQRLLRANGQLLSDDELLAGPMDAQLILQSFQESSEDEIQQLQTAASNNNLPVIEELLTRPQDPDLECQGRSGPALHWACIHGCLETARLLLEAKANKDNLSAMDKTPIALASVYGHTELVELLLEANADKDKASSDGSTALMEACLLGRLEVVQLLLEAKADKDKANDLGTTAISMASAQGHAEVVRVLLEANADKDKADSNGLTSLMRACLLGRLEVVQLLLEAKADKDKADNLGTTAICMASAKGHEKVVRVLLGLNADKDQVINDAASRHAVPKRRRLE